ncbi:MAG: DUF4124 domain-containing protein [Pseudomonadales bacterium]|nr:DUF4124 domain-containing protein [Pseudomonadales bacterium]
MNKKLITTIALSVLATASYAEDEYYKWVDERGVTHYSETLPDDGKIKAQKINVSTFIPRGSEQAINNLQQQRAEKAEAHKENKEGVSKTGSKAKTDVSKASADYKEKCASLKQDLANLTEKGSRVSVKEADGSVRKMTAEEIAKRTDETKREITAYCQ